MKIVYKIYKVVDVVYATVPDGYYIKDLIRTELREFDCWNDTFDSEDECIAQIKEYGIPTTRYTIQKEFIL